LKIKQEDTLENRIKNLRMFPRLATGKLAFRNRGDLTFEEVGREWGFDTVGVSHGMCLADLDGDGGLDVVVNAAGNSETHPMMKGLASAKAYVAYAQAHPGTYGLMFRTERLDMTRPSLHEAAKTALDGARLELDQAAVAREPVSTLDPTRGHARLSFVDATAQPLGGRGAGWPVVERVLDRAAVLFAFEQIGGADRSLEMARDYALERRAFGRQIGSFQALKHMMADMYVSATLARSNAYYAAWALSTDSADLPQAAAAARVSATQAFQHCARNNIQVHGGMGFTWEFDCHLYYRRSNLLALSLGSLSHWEDRLKASRFERL